MTHSSIPNESFLAALYSRLPEALPEFLMGRRWFGGKARQIKGVEVSDVIPVHRHGLSWYLILARVRYDSGPDEIYDVPLVRVPGEGPRTVSDPASILRFRNES